MGGSATPFNGGDISDSERIAYIQEVLMELRSVSKQIKNNDVLTYFLEMASLEAADKTREIKRQK